VAAALTDWYEMELLDAVDISRNRTAEAARLKDHLPALSAELDRAREHVAGSLTPVPWWHPSDDTWDDQRFFVRAMIDSDFSAKATRLNEMQQQLMELSKSDDPGRKVAGWVLTAVHGYIKGLGLGGGHDAARRQSHPASVGGESLAEIIWQARNQDQHHNDARELNRYVLNCFRKLVPHDLDMFGLARMPSTNEALQILLHQQSWAPEVLRILGWTSSAAAVVGVQSIAPG